MFTYLDDTQLTRAKSGVTQKGFGGFAITFKLKF